MGQLKLKEMFFGKTDAYNEYISFGKDTCRDVFFEFPNIDLQSIINGEVYYICGDKGTGKTMLLKHIETTVQEREEPTFTSFIRFKKDIDDDQRNQIKRSGSVVSIDETIDNSQIIDPSVDCRLAWQVYLVKTIVFNLSETKHGVFKRDYVWDSLVALIQSIYGDINEKKSTTIIPKIKRGNIEINVAAIAKFGFEFEWSDLKKKTVSYKFIANKVLDLYGRLSPVDDSMFVFIDELELSFKKGKQYERDIILIRDLIFAIQYLSEITTEKQYKVHFISAIRNEVYKSVHSMGMEINKPIHDFGIQISWQQKGGDIKDHPLLQMLIKRIEYSEKTKGLKITNDIWKEYFSSEINKRNICNYIINQTWNKPRDIIRLFTIIQQQFGEKQFIDQKIFDSVRQQYSVESWEELTEALSAKYTDMQIEGIRHILQGISLPFTTLDFSSRIDGMCDAFEEVERIKNIKPAQILRDMYDIGVIGNYCHVPRFVFLGDRDIDPLSPVTIHYPLIKFFRASMRAFEIPTQAT